MHDMQVGSEEGIHPQKKKDVLSYPYDCFEVSNIQ